MAFEKDLPKGLAAEMIIPGPSSRLYWRTLSGNETNRVFMQVPGEEAWIELGFVLGADLRDDSRSVVQGDLDGDGDLDLVIRSETPAKLHLLRNDGPVAPSVELRFATTRLAAGTTLKSSAAGKTRRSSPLLGQGYLSEDPPRYFLPLEGTKRLEQLEIQWPDGHTLKASSVPAGKLVRVRAGPPLALEITDRGAPKLPSAAPDPRGSAETLQRPCDPARLRAYAPGVQASDAGETPAQGPRTLATTQPEKPGRAPQLRVFNYWASWCKPCLRELPALAAFAKAHPKFQVQLLDASATPLGHTPKARRAQKTKQRLLKKLAPSLPNLVLTRAQVKALGPHFLLPSSCVSGPKFTPLRSFPRAISSEVLELLALDQGPEDKTQSNRRSEDQPHKDPISAGPATE